MNSLSPISRNPQHLEKPTSKRARLGEVYINRLIEKIIACASDAPGFAYSSTRTNPNRCAAELTFTFRREPSISSITIGNKVRKMLNELHFHSNSKSPMTGYNTYHKNTANECKDPECQKPKYIRTSLCTGSGRHNFSRTETDFLFVEIGFPRRWRRSDSLNLSPPPEEEEKSS